jgi:hypothetical protein
MAEKHPFPYIADAGRQYGVDDVQVVNPRGTTFDRNKFIDSLTAVDYAALSEVYEQIGSRDDARRISQWIQSKSAEDGLNAERRRAFLLFVLFKALGDEHGVHPFSDKKVRFSPPPPPPPDWSKLPKDLSWIAAPAEKYGIYQFFEEVDDFYSNRIQPGERAELRALAAKCEHYDAEIDQFLRAYPMTKHQEAELVSFFRDLLDDDELWKD